MPSSKVSSSARVKERVEGAVASIVSDAAEVATRGMDSADEEPELPSAIQDLIRRLEGKGEPMTRLPNLNEAEFVDFFPERASLSTIIGWRSQVRLRVLKAIGNCNTLEYLELYHICDRDISTLTARKWDVVLSGFRCSTVLRVITISYLKCSSEEEVERLCLELGRILNTSRVVKLEISDCRLSAICYLNLASGMRGKSESKLEFLEFDNAAWEDSSAVKHVADMINSATRLEMLSLGNRYKRYTCHMDEEVVRTMSQAINQSSSLKTLKLVGVTRGASALLRKVFASDDGNRSIEHLEMRHMRVLGNCVGDLLIYKELRLKEVTLDHVLMDPEEWRVVREAIRVITTVKTIKVSRHKILEGLEELVCAASSDDKDLIIEVSIYGTYDIVSEPFRKGSARGDQIYKISQSMVGEECQR